MSSVTLPDMNLIPMKVDNGDTFDNVTFKASQSPSGEVTVTTYVDLNRDGRLDGSPRTINLGIHDSLSSWLFDRSSNVLTSKSLSELTGITRDTREDAKTKMDREVAAGAGELGVLRDDSSLDSPLPNTGLGVTQQPIGGLTGAKGTQMGSGGLDSRPGLSGPIQQPIGGLTGAKGTQMGSGSLNDPGEDTTGGLTSGNFGTGRSIEGDPLPFRGLDMSNITPVIQRNQGILYAYKNRPETLADLGGKLRIRFTINSSGLAENVSVASSEWQVAGKEPTAEQKEAIKKMEASICAKIEGLQFTQPAGGLPVTVASYPFIFSPG
jgi:hypothetical protein